MLRIFSTHRLFAFLLTGLMITSCGGGTSSHSRDDDPIPTIPPTPQSLTVRVPSLNYAQTITKSTTISDIVDARRSLSMQCASLETNPFGSKAQACVAEVKAAYDQAVAFINR
ncbi:MAG: hypothetical protein ACKO9R_20320 [Dolichospermum sp.]